MMVCVWLFCHFVLSEPSYIPPRTLFATITRKSANYSPNLFGSISNYLVIYYQGQKGLGGLARYTFFLPHPTISSFYIGFAGLIALDIKNRFWSWSIFAACVFLILVCQSRNAWLALSIVLVVRWLLTKGKTGGIAFLLMLFAITSFTTLSLPTVTDYITESYTNSVESSSNFRKASTDDRNKIYQRTWEIIVEEPLVGHGVNGPPVTPGYDFARIGAESFVLGTLLYKSGLLGTGVFLTFFTSFLSWLYKTRQDRPLSCFMMLLYLSLASLVTEFLTPEFFLVLLCMMLCDPEQNQSKQATSIKRLPVYKS
jgi:hypothetical protein